VENPKSIFGILSVVLPGIVGGIWVVFEMNPQLGNGLNGYLGLFVAAFMAIASVIAVGAGLIFGITALIRKERNKSFAILGLVLNIAMIFWLRRHV